MKTIKSYIKASLPVWGMLISLSGCTLVGLDAQKQYDYKKVTLDPHINISARKLLEDRASGTGSAAVSETDTIFKWMKKGLDYAGIDLAEFEKSGRTFIFLHNDAIRVRNATTGAITAGLWFSYPIVTGTTTVNGITTYQTRIATKWEDYPKQDVKNLFLYLIGQGEYNFADLGIDNIAVQSLLPANSVTSKNSMLGYINDQKGFDQEGKFYLKILNNHDLAPIVFNNSQNVRSGGLIATNGIVHVFGASLSPFLLRQ